MRVKLAWMMSGAFLVFVLGGCTETRPREDTENCLNSVDDDGDGLVDCDDEDCAAAPACVEPSDEVCDNGEDDDQDGDVDCDDSDCSDDPDCSEPPTEICDNGEDDDGDDDIDCDDIDCGGDPACPGTEDCENGEDDDGDDLIDCDDTDCEGHDACVEPSDEDCENGEDDDGDDLIDCDDPDCSGDPACPEGEDCENGEDDDGDDLIDCDDPDCEGHDACPEPTDEICDNDEDDDLDGATDCDDPECEGDPACGPVEICNNTEDDDEDGLVDCADEDCADDPVCDEVCNNGSDDDVDGLVDCADEDCAGDPACLEVCDNGEDDDVDGLIDCADDDCLADPACAEDCGNGVDDDGDGLVDCMDESCDFDLVCAELCNGVDDDGDGRVDEFPIDPRIGEPCYGGDPAFAGVGQCVEGVWECFGGSTQCIGWVAPDDDELCDGLDNDCDGVVPPEEADADCGTTVTPGDLTNLELATEVRDVDVHFNLDTTGSMGGEAEVLRRSLSTFIVPEVRAVLPTAAFGVSTFDDFPFGSFGGGADWPFTLHQRVTTNVSLVQDAIDAIPLHGGADLAESGIEALYQIATGEGVTWPDPSSWQPEWCDDWWGADEDGDGLVNCEDPDCFAEAACFPIPREDCTNGVDDDGDGIVDCDDPNCAIDHPEDCTYVFGTCGNGVINRGEQCDDGGTRPGDGCNARCQLESGCGNAYLGGTEQCDDGNNDDGDGCAADCTLEGGVCGDGVLDVGEQCDDGNTDVGDGCDADCVIEPECGNASLDAGEDCDDGNTDDGDDCAADCTSVRLGVEPFDAEDGFDPGLGHGLIGGVGFRSTSIPLVVHITDAPSHEADDYLPFGATAHDSGATYDALNAIGARILAIRTGDWARTDDPVELYPTGMTAATNSIVPACAFDGSPARVAGTCAEDECCTGIDGEGRSQIPGGGCLLVFDARNDGTGLEDSVVVAIEAITRFITYELSVVARDDPVDGVDATCFVESLGIVSAEGPGGDCSIDPVTADRDGDGVDDVVTNATPRTRATFSIAATNVDVNDVDGDGDVAEACAGSGTYGLFLDVMADGRTVVASRRVEVVVP